jgi:hypothetical protein
MVAAIRSPLALCLIAILACAAMAAAPMAPMRPIGAPTPAATPSAVNPGLPAGASQAPAPPTPPAGSGQPDTSAPGSANPNPKSPSPDAWTVCPAPGKFITCLLATDAALWVGTEDASLWRLDLSADPTQPSSWRQFTTAETHTDNIYGLAEDYAGRLWVGTQNQGVSVYNGQSWRNYGVIDGPIGEHVFAIAADADPARGSVWIATDHGLSSWTPAPDVAVGPAKPPAVPGASTAVAAAGSSAVVAGNPKSKIENLKSPADTLPSSPAASTPSLAPGTWRHFTKADGLPSSQIYAVTVDAKGRVFAGTECDGLAFADPPYNKWQCVRAEYERSGDGAGGGRPMTAMSAGGAAGLPSNLSNFLLALPDGSVAYSTCYGVGLSRDGGRSWTGWQGISSQPYENYARGLASDKAGGLWIGTEHKGLVRLDTRTGAKKSFTKPALPDDYVFSVAVTKDGSVWAGTYGEGLARSPREEKGVSREETRKGGTGTSGAGLPGQGAIPASMAGPSPASKSAAPAAVSSNPKSPPLLPAPAAPPTLDELNAMLAALSKVPFIDPAKQPTVIRLDDDWLTKGEWLGRHGRYWACLCAASASYGGCPINYIWGGGPEPVAYWPCAGPNHRKGDGIRYWVHWNHTSNPNSLELTTPYLHSRVLRGLTSWDVNRRQAEWDDHSETYPMPLDGPSLYCTLKVPAGLFYLSVYNFNKDGHGGGNRLRDFRIAIRPHAAGRELANISDFNRQPELAHGRIRDFWGSVYERYLVRGPTEITVEINRNHSFCTILAGLFLDLVDEEPVPYFHDLDEWKVLGEMEEKLCEVLRKETPAEHTARFRPSESEAEAAVRLFDELQKARLLNAVWWATEGREFYSPLARWNLAAMKGVGAGPEKQRLLARATTCQYQLGLYEKWEAGQVALGKTPARQIEKALRWDQETSFNGRGFEIISSYVEQMKKRNPK